MNRNTITVRIGIEHLNGINLKKKPDDEDYNTIFELTPNLDKIFWQKMDGYLEIEKLSGIEEVLENGNLKYKMNLSDLKIKALLAAFNQVVFKGTPSSN